MRGKGGRSYKGNNKERIFARGIRGNLGKGFCCNIDSRRKDCSGGRRGIRSHNNRSIFWTPEKKNPLSFQKNHEWSIPDVKRNAKALFRAIKPSPQFRPSRRGSLFGSSPEGVERKKRGFLNLRAKSRLNPCALKKKDKSSIKIGKTSINLCPGGGEGSVLIHIPHLRNRSGRPSTGKSRSALVAR